MVFAITILAFPIELKEVKAEVPEVKVEPIPEPEMDWSNFTSIYEEDLEVAKAEELAIQKAKAEEKKQRVQQTSESDVMLLARVMHAEEGILRKKLSYEEAKMAHMLAGSVILNRRNMHYLGDTTIAEVIYAPGQYACIENLNQKIPQETIEWAQELIDNGPIGPSNMIYQAEFEQGSETYAHIGNQYFCCK